MKKNIKSKSKVVGLKNGGVHRAVLRSNDYLSLRLKVLRVVLVVGIVGFAGLVYAATVTGFFSFELIFLFIISSLLMIVASNSSTDVGV